MQELDKCIRYEDTSRLISLLNSDNPRKRVVSAKFLGKIGDSKAIKALKQMARGIKVYNPRSWENLWISKPREYYTVDDQLAAIDGLAETSSKKAFNYLSKLKNYSVKKIKRKVKTMQGDTVRGARRYKIVFPYVEPPLKNSLEFMFSVSKGKFNSWKPLKYRDFIPWEYDLNYIYLIVSKTPEYSRINKALQKLRNNLFHMNSRQDSSSFDIFT